MPSTTPHRVHNIPDITSIVFKCLNVETFMNHALVCKAWLEPALDEMWWYINQPVNLFKLLGPMHMTSQDSVYTLEHDLNSFYFPTSGMNLEISIKGDLMDEHAFKEAGTFLYEFAHIQTPLLDLLRSLRRLEELGLPRYWITTSVLATVAALPCLQAIRSDIDGKCKGDMKDVEIIDDFSPQEGSFPVFYILIFDISFTCATKLFQNTTFPARLTRLWINTIDFVVPSTLHNFLQLCAAGYPALIALGFDLFPNDPDSFIPSGEITLETLKPLYPVQPSKNSI
ncbi:hypothetical protein BU17DRAFT_97658 [Hysterangium stoloniferum]|nr:hypothetical protein BU17DRAFT_97658 [Hysterangium stoloniferum]